MTPEAQRIAIAEACGWINQGLAKGIVALEHRWLRPGTRNDFGDPPNYLSDLNATRDAWLTLNDAQRFQFRSELSRVLINADPTDNTWYEGATAAQWCEAFLRTLGLWKDAAA